MCYENEGNIIMKINYCKHGDLWNGFSYDKIGNSVFCDCGLFAFDTNITFGKLSIYFWKWTLIV